MKEIIIKKLQKFFAILLGLFITTHAVSDVKAAELDEINSQINSVRQSLRNGQSFRELKDSSLYLDDMSSPELWPNWGNWGNWNNWNNWNNWAKWAKWDNWNNWGNR
jgi:hypothetical protein